MRVLVELASTKSVFDASMGFEPSETVLAPLAERMRGGFRPDPAYAPVQLPVRAKEGFAPERLAFGVQESTYLIRGEIPDAPRQREDAFDALTKERDVVGVFADAVTEILPVCPNTPPVGAEADVATLMQRSLLQKSGMDGHGVLLAVVDTGINAQYLQERGRRPVLDVGRSWAPAGTIAPPGQQKPAHGTMCAFDATILAPGTTLLDCPLLLSSVGGATLLAGLLSDAVLAYRHLLNVLLGLPDDDRRLIVSNSWGLFDPAWDFPPGHPGNYSDSPVHPFNLITGALETGGADILFAAGNCGPVCPDIRCRFGGTPSICGANAHPAVLTVGGVDVTGALAGYSSHGPGRIVPQKPDICAYTHFAGSKIAQADGGTSAACPVAAGLVAAIRSRFSATALSPARLRTHLRNVSKHPAGSGYDHGYGWGVPDVTALLAALP